MGDITTFSNLIPSFQLEMLHQAVERDLTASGYLPVKSDRNTGEQLSRPGAIAYSREPVPFKHEPIIIDDGLRDREVDSILKITVRDPTGSNRDLDTRLREIMASYGVSNPKIYVTSPEGSNLYIFQAF